MKNKKTVLVVLLLLTIGFTSLGQTSEVIVVDAPYKWIKGYGWTPETIVTLNIIDETMVQIYSGTGTVDENGEVLFDLRVDDQGNVLFDLQPHQIVILFSDTILKQISVENLSVTSVDLESDTISGTSDPSAYVNVKVSGYPEIQVKADIDGFWIADFSTIADLHFSSKGMAYREDNDGDWSQTGWAINPVMWIDPNLHNGGQTGGWLLGSSITVKVDDPTTGKQPDYIGGPFQVFPDPSQLNATVATYYIRGFDVRGGHIVTITDGKYTREHLVHNIQLTSIDFLNDTISGTTDRGNEICAEFVVEGVWYDFICTSVIDGDWTIDCTVGDVDIEIGTLAIFQQRDEDGDSTDLHLYLSPTTEINIDDILKDFDESVEDQTLEGRGKGNSANGKLNALRNMLEMAGDLISIDDIEGACLQLNAVLRKCDGDSPPPDFVTGSAVSELYDMIIELLEELGCE